MSEACFTDWLRNFFNHPSPRGAIRGVTAGANSAGPAFRVGAWHLVVTSQTKPMSPALMDFHRSKWMIKWQHQKV